MPGKIHGKVYKKTCGHCGTKFEYVDSDIQHDERDGGWYLFCPHCNSFILIKSEDVSWKSADRSTDC